MKPGSPKKPSMAVALSGLRTVVVCAHFAYSLFYCSWFHCVPKELQVLWYQKEPFKVLQAFPVATLQTSLFNSVHLLSNFVKYSLRRRRFCRFEYVFQRKKLMKKWTPKRSNGWPVIFVWLPSRFTRVNITRLTGERGLGTELSRVVALLL